MVLTSKLGRIQPEIQIWADQVVAASWTRVWSPGKWEMMLIQLRSAMTPSWPAVHCTFRSSQCSDQSTQRSHLQRIANILKQSAPHIGNLLTFSHASATRWSRSKISWWAMKTFNCIFSLTPLWAEKYLAENPGPTAALHDVAVVELEFFDFYSDTL